MAKNVTFMTVDKGGDLVRSARPRIALFSLREGEQATIYELGIPVVTTGDVFHYDVRQRIPLAINRNNVSPAYLRRLRAAVLDVTVNELTPEQAANRGVTDGIALAKPETRVALLDTRFGKNRYIPDFNRESSGELFSEGATPVAPGTFDGDTWAALKDADAIKSANQLRPKLTVAGVAFDPDKVTGGMELFRRFAEYVCRLTLGKEITEWTWSDTPQASTLAQCGPRGGGGVALTINVANLGVDWFNNPSATTVKHIDLIIHELGHHDGALDCTREHANEMTRIAARLAVAMVTDPKKFDTWVR